MNYLTEYYKNQCAKLIFEKNILLEKKYLLEVQGLEQSDVGPVAAMPSQNFGVISGDAEPGEENQVWGLIYKIFKYLGDEGIYAAYWILKKAGLINGRTVEEVMEIIKTLPNFTIPGRYKIINGIKIPSAPKLKLKYFENPPFGPTWPLNNIYRGKKLPDGVYIDERSQKFWILEKPSELFPNGRPMQFDPSTGEWNTYYGNPTGNPFGIDVIYNG